MYVADGDSEEIIVSRSLPRTVSTNGSGGTRESGDEKIGGIAGLATDSDNNVFVVDDGNRCIKRFSSEGEFHCKWGEPGDQEGQFLSPMLLR